MIMKPIHLGPPGGISIGPRPNTLGTGVGVRGPYAAPSGWRWVVLTEQNAPLTDGGARLIELERIVA